MSIYDVFISYSVADRRIVEQLTTELRKSGLRIWYTRDELVPGHDIYETVSYGLKNSRYGIAIISPNYISKWTMGELFELKSKKNRLIPILHNISIHDAISLHPELSDLYAMSSNAEINEIVREIRRKIKTLPKPYYWLAIQYSWLRRKSTAVLKFFSALTIICILIVGALSFLTDKPSESTLRKAINDRILHNEDLIKKKIQDELLKDITGLSSLSEVSYLEQKVFSSFQSSTQRIRFQFHNGHDQINSLAGLKNAGILHPIGTPVIPYGMKNYRIYLGRSDSMKLKYAILNEDPLTYKIEEKEMEGSVYKVHVVYSNNLRYAQISKSYDTHTKVRESVVSMAGYKIKETFLFVKKNNEWINTTVQ